MFPSKRARDLTPPKHRTRIQDANPSRRKRRELDIKQQIELIAFPTSL